MTQAQQPDKSVQQDDEKPLACRNLDADVFPPETCSIALTYLAPTDTLGWVGEDGSFIVLSPLPDGKMDPKTYYFPPKLRSTIALNLISQTLRQVRFSAADEPNGIFTAMLPQGRDLWSKLLEVYCYYHPAGIYTDLDEAKQRCLPVTHLPNEKTLEGYFSGAEVFNLNYVTFLQAAEAVGRSHNPK